MFRLSQKADYGLILLSSLAKLHSVAGFHSRSEVKAISGGHSGSVTDSSEIHPRGEVKAMSGLHPGGVNQAGYVSISSVAARHKLSPKFLSQIARELKEAGILKSKEGVSGGYNLAKKPREIKIIDVLNVLEGKFFEGRCFEEKGRCICGANIIWKDMKKQVETVLGGKSVADLVKSKPVPVCHPELISGSKRHKN